MLGSMITIDCLYIATSQCTVDLLTISRRVFMLVCTMVRVKIKGSASRQCLSHKPLSALWSWYMAVIL